MNLMMLLLRLMTMCSDDVDDADVNQYDCNYDC